MDIFLSVIAVAAAASCFIALSASGLKDRRKQRGAARAREQARNAGDKGGGV